MGIEKQPSEKEEKKYSESENVGKTDIEEFSGFEEFLHPDEEIKLFSGAQTDGDGKKLIAITNERLISFTSSETRLLGEKKEFKDINLESIEDITVETRKGFDILAIQTKQDSQKFMTPEKEGIKISGYIRTYQKDRPE